MAAGLKRASKAPEGPPSTEGAVHHHDRSFHADPSLPAPLTFQGRRTKLYRCGRTGTHTVRVRVNPRRDRA
jgi:hypothetical protein